MARPRLTDVTRLFARVGVTVFGGGDPTIAILQREFYRRDWLSPEKFAIAFGLARLTPGTNVLAFCAAAGWYILGLGGALAAVLAITIPASVLVVWLTRAYDLTAHNRLAQSIANALARRRRRHHDRRGSPAGSHAMQARPMAQAHRHLTRRVPSGLRRSS